MTGTLVSSSLIFESSPNALVITNADGIIVQSNPQTEHLFGYTQGELIGQTVDVLVPKRFVSSHHQKMGQYLVSPVARRLGEGRDLFGLHKNGTEIPIEIALTPIHFQDAIFILATLIDLTIRKALERELEMKIVALQEAMDNIKKLEGYIPICMYCKKIRDDQESWHQLEQYISDHSNAKFSHGICPDCKAKEPWKD